MTNDPTRLPLSFCDVLEEEYDALHTPPHVQHARELHEPARMAAIYARIHSLKSPAGAGRTALCLSGGGIRSASFALGVVQALARHRLLDGFHYLSTVSGGGYVGGWLTAWIHRKGLGAVCGALRSHELSSLAPEPAPIRYLRAFSNYLTPRLGLLSADTWTLGAIYLRNLVLNWLVLVPLLLLVLAIPRLCMSAMLWTPAPGVQEACLILGAVSAILALYYVGLHRPTAQTGYTDDDSGCARPIVEPEAREVEPKGRRPGSQGEFLLKCLLPLVVSSASFTTCWAWMSAAGVQLRAWHFVLLAVAIHVLAFVAYWATLRRLVFSHFVGVVVSGALGGLFVYWPALAFTPQTSGNSAYVSFSTPLYLMAFFLASALYVGLGTRRMTDDDREWAARCGGWILIVAVCWGVFSALTLDGPWLLQTFWARLGALGGLSGLVTVVLGMSAKAPARDQPKGATKGTGTLLGSLFARYAPVLAAPLFLLFLAALLSLLTSQALKQAAALFSLLSGPGEQDLQMAGWSATNPTIGLTSGFMALMIVVALGASHFISVNKYSLHALYRNRLIRAFLGASREEDERRPNPFTGFDPTDNIGMHRLWPDGCDGKVKTKLFHVVNCTLNLVKGGENLAWQERKAESFTISPLHCGSHHLAPGYRRASQYARGAPRRGTSGKAISLGTAVAISGAAASPNMGYNSSPVVTFLMTLFNARLGWWLGNPGPAGRDTFDKAHPPLSAWPIVSEALGLTDDRNPFVYLSDGGHFENLGLYEMVLRRCHLIVVSDAGCDPAPSSFEDLGNALRKIRIDFGVPIQFTAFNVDTGVAVGDILYEQADGEGAMNGLLVYIKPTLVDSAPVDVHSYKRAHPEFPQESTSDQWFTESQFESYRALGFHIADRFCQDRGSSLDELAKSLRPPSP